MNGKEKHNVKCKA